jgi:hypothetical protein
MDGLIRTYIYYFSISIFIWYVIFGKIKKQKKVMPEEHTDSVCSWARWFNKDLHLSFFYFYIYLIGDIWKIEKTVKGPAWGTHGLNPKLLSLLLLVICFYRKKNYKTKPNASPDTTWDLRDLIGLGFYLLILNSYPFLFIIKSFI